MIEPMREGERRREVRLAAKAWERAGWIDAAGRAEIDRRYSDDRARMGLALRALIFCGTSFAVCTGFGTFMAAGELWAHESALGAAFLVAGVLCTIGAEMSHIALRTSGVGADDALELCALGFLFGAFLQLFDLTHRGALGFAFLLGAALAAVGAWRWGGWLYGALASAAGFLALAETPAPRLAWVLVAAALTVPLLRLGDSSRLAPSQRLACRSALVVTLAALYLATNYASLDHDLLENLWRDGLELGVHSDWMLPLAMLGTVLVPAGVLAVGIVRRDRLVLGCGLVLVAASALTLRWYVHIAPLWTVLLLSGAALGGAALAVRRLLDGGAGHERRGFTAEVLLDGGRRQLVEMAAAVAAFSPAANPQAEPGHEWSGGGGRGGGGGAGADF